MSLCLALQAEKILFMSGDSRESKMVDGQHVATGLYRNKIHQIGNKVIFAGGSASVITSLLDDFRHSSNQSIENLQHLSRKHKMLFIEKYGSDYLGSTHHADLLVGAFENGRTILYGLSSVDDFHIMKRVGSKQLEAACAGCHVKEATSYYRNYNKPAASVMDMYKDLYYYMENEEIGGELTVYQITGEGVHKECSPIVDSRSIKVIDWSQATYNSDVMEWSVNGTRRLYYNNLENRLSFSGTLEAADGIFSGDLSAVGGTFTGELVAASGTFKGALQAATGTFTGDLSAVGGTFTGTLQGVDGNFSGTISASTIIGSTITGGTVTGTTVNGGQVNGAQINGGTINVDTDVYIGKKLYMNPSSYTSDIVFSSGINIYGDPSGGGLFLNAFGGVRLNGINVVSEINGLLARVAALEAGS